MTLATPEFETRLSPAQTQGEEASLRRSVLNWKTAASFILCLGLVGWFATRIDLDATLGAMRSMHVGWFAAAFVAYYASFPVRGLRWRTLLSNVGLRERWSRLTELVFLSYFANSIVPAKLGDVYKGYLLRRNYGHPLSASGGTIVMERILDVLVLAVLFSACGILAFGENIPASLRTYVYGGFAASVAIAGVLLFSRRLSLRLLAFVAGRLPERVGAALERLGEGFYASVNSRTLAPVLGLTVASWLLEATRIYFVILALGISLPLPAIAFAAFAASFLTAIPFTPAGLGAVEVGVVGILMLFGVPLPIAAAVAILDRVVSFWILIASGATWAAVTPRAVI
jgi:uncharacterized protein (TIRG00374 family)